MSPSDINNVAATVFTGFFMFVAVYWPKVFGDGFGSRLVFTINFLAFALNFGALDHNGVI